MATLNFPNPGTDPTVRVFDDFYKRELVIDSNQYDNVFKLYTKCFPNQPG